MGLQHVLDNLILKHEEVGSMQTVFDLLKLWSFIEKLSEQLA